MEVEYQTLHTNMYSESTLLQNDPTIDITESKSVASDGNGAAILKLKITPEQQNQQQWHQESPYHPGPQSDHEGNVPVEDDMPWNYKDDRRWNPYMYMMFREQGAVGIRTYTYLVDEHAQDILPPGRISMTIKDCISTMRPGAWISKLNVGSENCMICIAEGSDIQEVVLYKNGQVLQSDDSFYYERLRDKG